MINSLGEIIVDQTTGYSKEDAVLLLLGIKLGEDAECDGISLDDILDAEKEHAEVGCLQAKDAKEQAEAAYANAQAEKLSDEAIKTAFDDLEKANQKLSEANQSLIKTDQLITKAAQYRRDITDELAKKESALRRDESNRITINSFNQWSHDVLQISILDKLDIGKSDITQSPRLAPMEAIEIPSIAPTQPKKSQRDNALSLELNEILRKNPRAKPAEVMMVLRRLVGAKNSIIIDVSDEGVKWTKDDGNVAITSREALGERIQYWRKHRLSPD